MEYFSGIHDESVNSLTIKVGSQVFCRPIFYGRIDVFYDRIDWKLNKHIPELCIL